MRLFEASGGSDATATASHTHHDSAAHGHCGGSGGLQKRLVAAQAELAALRAQTLALRQKAEAAGASGAVAARLAVELQSAKAKHVRAKHEQAAAQMDLQV